MEVHTLLNFLSSKLLFKFCATLFETGSFDVLSYLIYYAHYLLMSRIGDKFKDKHAVRF